jgi:alpha/beta hydrolase fold
LAANSVAGVGLGISSGPHLYAGGARFDRPQQYGPPSKETTTMTHTHTNAATLYVAAKGIRFAYRRFGEPNGTPLLFMQHFRGGMDHWDPAVTDGFARSRPVILFDNAGVAGSSGKTPQTIEAMAEHAADFVEALGLAEVDLLGFSIGGYVAQALTLFDIRA